MTGVATADTLAEEIRGLLREFGANAWIDSGVGGSSASLDDLGPSDNPLGTVLRSGLPWLVEQVQPLVRALDWVTGAPAGIRAFALECRDAAAAVSDGADKAATAVRKLARWNGPGSRSYQGHAADEQAALRALAVATAGQGEIALGAGVAVARGRVELCQHLRAFVEELRAQMPTWFAQYPSPSALAPLPPILAMLAALVARFAGLIARVLAAVRHSLAAVGRFLSRLRDQATAVGRWLRRRLFGEEKEEPRPDHRPEQPHLPDPPEPPKLPEPADQPRELTQEEKYRQLEESRRKAYEAPQAPPDWEDRELSEDEKWRQAIEDSRRMSREQAEAQRYTTPEAAIGMPEGRATPTGEVDPIRSEGLREEGFTERRYYRDAEGTKHSLDYNPATGEYRRAHTSSGR